MKLYFTVNCVVLDVAPVAIGNNALFGPGSVARRDLPPGVFGAGNPYRALRQLPR